MDPLQEIKKFELLLLDGNFLDLLNNKDIQSYIDACPAPENVDDCSFSKEDSIRHILSKLAFNDSLRFTENLQNLSKQIEHVIKAKDSLSFEFLILLVGVSALQEFLKYNWTGPSESENSFSCFSDTLKKSGESKAILYFLSRAGEYPFENVKHPELLLLGHVLLSPLVRSRCATAKWWQFRCLMIHQRVLAGESITLYDEMKLLTAETLAMELFEENVLLKVQLLIEIGHMHLYYQQVTPAKKFFSEAQDIAGLEIELVGAIGKRTQYQQKSVAQLLVRMKRNKSLPESDLPLSQVDLPCDTSLQDDVLLNRVQFLDISDNDVQNLHPEEQLVLLSQCCLLQKSQASDELLDEKLMAYIDCLIGQQKIWSIQFRALFMRCKLDKNKSRKIERAKNQIEVLLSDIKKEKPDIFARQYLFYSSSFPPSWVLQKELADILFSLSLVKDALKIYEHLELWEDIVKCCALLGRYDQAAMIIHEQLATKETPTLWCLLGDITNDESCYFRAWELSSCKCPRSQRSLGYLYYKKADYHNCIPFFKKSVELCPLQTSVWFSLGFAASQTQDYELSAQAYRQVVSLDSDNFEAWNNLSNSYIKLKQKERAYKTYQEALKCNYEDWRVWENYLLVCVDIGAFEDAIQCCHRLLDIKKKFEDAQVLAIIVKAITLDVLDFTEQITSRLKNKALQLFGRVTASVPNNGDIWKSYADLHLSDPECLNNVELMALVVQYLQKSVNCTAQKAHGMKNIPSCKNVISNSCQLADAYVNYFKLLDGDVKIQNQARANLTLKNILVRIEKQLKDFLFADTEELEEDMKLLRSKISILSLINE